MEPLEDMLLPSGPISSPRIMDAVVGRLRESILRGRFAPGERIVEADLARELGISRGPIREALGVLEKDGIVESVPRKGKFVLRFDRRRIDEIYSLRKVMETYAAEMLMNSLTAYKRELLEKAATEIEATAASGSAAELSQRDLAFHNLLYELADHEALLNVWNEHIAGKLRILVNVTTQTHDPLSDAGRNHRVLVESIVRRRKGDTRRLISEHIDDAWRRASSSLQLQV